MRGTLNSVMWEIDFNMIQKIKDFTNNSLVWLVAAFAAIFYFWRKERDLEDKLEEERANETVKTDQAKIADADSAANTELEHYESLRKQYNSDLQSGTGQLRQGSEASTSPDSDKR